MSPPAWTHTGFAQRLHFGVGAARRLPDVVREVGARRLLLVTSAGRLSSADGQRLVESLGRSLASTFDGVRSHNPTDVVQAALLQARRDGVDGVVSFGGGSAMDLGKAVVYFTEQEAGTPGTTYLDRPVLPHIAIPTTYSGAEVTMFFGMTDERTRTKGGGGGPTSAPVAVVYDPELTLDTPRQVTAETSLNALAHCVEAVYAIQRSPEAEAIALAGAARINDALPRVIDDLADAEARTDLLAGAALAGRALQNASMGVHHGLSQQLGGRTGISHGLANALVLPHAMRFNAPVVPEAMDALADALGDGDDPAAAVERLRTRVGLPSRLRDVGVTEDDLDAVARLSQSNQTVQRNPRPVSEEDARAILTAAY
jgi:alcohol dehydrogenase class IV